MEPRVKLYGLFSRSRRRYLLESTLGLAALLGLFVGWYFYWPTFQERLQKIEQYHLNRHEPPLPTYMTLTVAVLGVLPWILTAVALFKCLEMFLVLRAFARKDAARPMNAPRP